MRSSSRGITDYRPTDEPTESESAPRRTAPLDALAENQPRPDSRHRAQHPDREIDTPSPPLLPPLSPVSTREAVAPAAVLEKEQGLAGPCRPEFGPLEGP